MKLTCCEILKFLLWVIAVFLIIAIAVPIVSETITQRVLVSIDRLNGLDAKIVISQNENIKIHTMDFFVERIVSFYETLITFLIAIIGLGGILSYLYIKHSHLYETREEIANFIETQTFKGLMSRELEKLINIEKTDGELKIQSDALESINQRLAFL